MSAIVRLRSSPRVKGTMQNVQYWLHPCMMLTNADTRRCRPLPQMFFDRRFAAHLGPGLDDLFAAARKNFVEIIGRAMKFLRADDQIDVGQLVNQLLSAALRHATHETEDDIGPMAADLGGDILHFADGFLLRHVAHAARVEQDDVGDRFGGGQGIALGHELGGDGLRIALVHLATVGLDVNTGHVPGTVCYKSKTKGGRCRGWGRTKVILLLTPLPKRRNGFIVSETLRYLQSESAEAGVEIGTLVKYLLMDAVKARASDIHIEPWESTLAVRIRLNGVLTELVHLPLELMEKISGRFKVLANLVTYQTGLPQEGHAPADPELGGVEQRISIFPTVRGEKIVVRIFDPSNRSFDLGLAGVRRRCAATVSQVDHQAERIDLIDRPDRFGQDHRHLLRALHFGAARRPGHQHRHGGGPGGIQPADGRAGAGQPGPGIHLSPGACVP